MSTVKWSQRRCTPIVKTNERQNSELSNRSSQFCSSSDQTEFWLKRECSKLSSFGYTKKDTTLNRKDEHYTEYDKVPEWSVRDKTGHNRGRLQLVSTIGNKLETPGPGEYSTKLEYRQGTHRVPTTVFEGRYSTSDKTKIPGPGAHTLPSSIRRTESLFIRPIGVVETFKKQIPGPGSYNDNIKPSSRYKEPQTHIMNTRNPVQPRMTLDLKNLEVHEHPETLPGTILELPGPGTHDIPRDPILPPSSSCKSMPLPYVESKEKLLNGDDFIDTPGPGTYIDPRVFGHGSPLSSPTRATLQGSGIPYPGTTSEDIHPTRSLASSVSHQTTNQQTFLQRQQHQIYEARCTGKLGDMMTSPIYSSPYSYPKPSIHASSSGKVQLASTQVVQTVFAQQTFHPKMKFS